MPTSLENPTLPFDPTGARVSNKVTGEQQVLVRVAFRDFHFLIPKLAPFFAGPTFKATYRDNSGASRPLVEGVDFLFGHKFVEASKACAKELYASISFLNTDLEGVVTFEYQSIGGTWTLDDEKLAEIVANELYNPRTVAWEQVADYPQRFPVIDHEWDLVDMVGMSEVVTALQGITAALLTTGDTGLAAHIANKDNPHGTTKTHVGLPLVENYAPATNAQMQTGTATNLYATPAGTRAAIATQALAPLNAHTSATGNVHGMVASDINAYTIPQVQALLAGKLNVDGVVQDSLKFDGRTPVDYRDWVLSFTAANSERFAGRTYEQMLDDVIVGGTENALKLNGRTDLETKAWVLEGKAADAGALDGRNSDALKAWVLTGTAADTAKFGTRDINEYKLWVLEGKAADSDRLEGRTFEETVDLLANRFASTEQSAKQRRLLPYSSSSANTWSLLGAMSQTPLSGQIQWLVNGGENQAAGGSAGAYFIRAEVTGPAIGDVRFKVVSLLGEADTSALAFGLVKNDTDGTYEVWARGPKVQADMTVTELTNGITLWPDDDSQSQATAPAGISSYATEDGFALRSEVEVVLDSLTTAFNNLTAAIAA